MAASCQAGGCQSIFIVSLVDLRLEHSLRCLPAGFEVSVVSSHIQNVCQFSTELKEPASAVVIDIDRARIFEQPGVEANNAPRKRSIQPGSRLLGLDVANFLL